MNLEGSRVIIFGGTSGIGLATASLAAQSGANVAIAGHDPDRLAGALAQLSAAQLSLGTLAADGSITFVTAASARAAFPGTVGLAAINGALNAAAATLALELKPRRVNVVSPGIVETPIWSHFPEEQRCNLLEREAHALPVGRIGQPEEVAQAIVMLMGNGFMTGAIIDCDGGARVK